MTKQTLPDRIARTIAAYPALQAVQRLAHELAATKDKADKIVILGHIDALIHSIMIRQDHY